MPLYTKLPEDVKEVDVIVSSLENLAPSRGFKRSSIVSSSTDRI